jgi:hypothetical protein
MGFFEDMFHTIEGIPEHFVDYAKAGMKATDHLNESTHGFSYAIPFYGVARGLMDSVVATDDVSKGKIGAGEWMEHLAEDEAQIIFSGVGSMTGISEGVGALYGSGRLANTMLSAGSRVSANTGRAIRNLPQRGSNALQDVRYSIRTRNLPKEGMGRDITSQTRLARSREPVLQRGTRGIVSRTKKPQEFKPGKWGYKPEVQRGTRPIQMRTVPKDPQASLRTGTGQSKIANQGKLSSRLLSQNPNIFKVGSGKIPQVSSDIQRAGMRGGWGLSTPVLESTASGIYMGGSLVG